MARSTSIMLAAAATLALAACAADQDYPSLSRRPAERISGNAQVVAAQPSPAPAPAPSPEFAERLRQLVAQAQDAHGRFARQRGSSERLVAAAGGAAVASEAWSVASVALASLESARSDAMVALAALDEIYAAEAVAAAASGDPASRDAAGAARDRVIALVGEEDAALAALRGRLRS